MKEEVRRAGALLHALLHSSPTLLIVCLQADALRPSIRKQHQLSRSGGTHREHLICQQQQFALYQRDPVVDQHQFDVFHQ
ncbi:hypothetical protein C2U33_05620 [Ralstonia solanacearum]|nr:hypothetical protein RSOE_23780 [Ralstonia solanacearum OE1-1]TYZ44288.1 hypothetical protein C2U33_05620 [Ralstonia solanacearum]